MDFSKLMGIPLKASRKSNNKFWNNVGLTVWLGEYNGEPQVSLVDERTGERYPCFAPKPRGEAPARTDEDTPF